MMINPHSETDKQKMLNKVIKYHMMHIEHSG